jgi:hypothetical protein
MILFFARLSGLFCCAADNRTHKANAAGATVLSCVQLCGTIAIAHFLPALAAGLQLLSFSTWGSLGSVEHFHEGEGVGHGVPLLRISLLPDNHEILIEKKTE